MNGDDGQSLEEFLDTNDMTMEELVQDIFAGGGTVEELGFSGKMAVTHTDGDGNVKNERVVEF